MDGWGNGHLFATGVARLYGLRFRVGVTVTCLPQV
jgi:hypothetical protein